MPSRLIRAVREFGAAPSGNVAIIFALALIPIIGFVGMAVDFSRANAVKVEMQTAMDSVALMLQKSAGTLTADQLTSVAQEDFLAVFEGKYGTNDIQVSATYSTSNGSHVVVSASAEMPTMFMQIFGIKELPVSGSTTAQWGNSRLRVALVLDNTGSMSDSGKLAALKTATTNLLTQLKDAVTTDGDVYVSIIPFVKDVSVDASGYNSSWDSWIQWDDGTDSSWDGANGTCSSSGYSPRSRCISHFYCSISGYNTQSSCSSGGTCSVSGYNTQSSCTSAGTCSKSGYNTQSSCQNAGTCSISGYTSQSTCTAAAACTDSKYTSQSKCTKRGGTWQYGTWTSTPGTWTVGVWTPGVWQQATWTPLPHSQWNGCFTDRGTSTAPASNAGYDQDVTEPTSSIPGTMYPAEQYNACPLATMGLNYDWSAMNSMVNSMVANGNTNQPIGLVWGWLSLVGGGPFEVPPVDPNYKYQQIIILLSDGLNTQDRWYTNQSSIDERMYDPTTGNGTCANIKAAGIIIYTIQVDTGGDPTSALLQHCASDTSKFFLLSSADQIVTTFNQIGTNLTQLYLAK
jgi:Flp pilus assembly protein TadG